MVPSVQRDISPEEHNLLVTKTIDLLKGSVEVKRAEILEYFHKVGTCSLIVICVRLPRPKPCVTLTRSRLQIGWFEIFVVKNANFSCI